MGNDEGRGGKIALLTDFEDFVEATVYAAKRWWAVNWSKLLDIVGVPIAMIEKWKFRRARRARDHFHNQPATSDAALTISWRGPYGWAAGHVQFSARHTKNL